MLVEQNSACETCKNHITAVHVPCTRVYAPLPCAEVPGVDGLAVVVLKLPTDHVLGHPAGHTQHTKYMFLGAEGWWSSFAHV